MSRGHEALPLGQRRGAGDPWRSGLPTAILTRVDGNVSRPTLGFPVRVLTVLDQPTTGDVGHIAAGPRPARRGLAARVHRDIKPSVGGTGFAPCNPNTVPHDRRRRRSKRPSQPIPTTPGAGPLGRGWLTLRRPLARLGHWPLVGARGGACACSACLTRCNGTTMVLNAAGMRLASASWSHAHLGADLDLVHLSPLTALHSTCNCTVA